MKQLASAALVLAVIASCAPVPMTRERAERECLKDVRGADGVSGQVGVGVGTGGKRAKGSITVTDKIFNPQTEEEFMRECVQRKIEGRPAPTRFGITIGASQ